MKRLITILFLSFNVSCFAQVNLNEMQSSNNSSISDDFGEFDDWIEIYNPTTDSVEIGGLILKDQVDTWTIPTGSSLTLIPPGGYFLIWADDQEFQGDFHTNFKLASGGEFLGLYEGDGLTVVDSITIPALPPNDSYIKCSTGWIQTSSPTPIADNNCSISQIENVNVNDLFSLNISNEKELEVSIVGDLKNQTIISINSFDGKELIERTLDNEKTILNLNMLNSNIYIVSIITPNFIYSKKIAL